MDAAARPRLSPAEGRRFAWTLAAAFAALGAFLLWRGHGWPPRVALALAAALAAAGLLVPGRLGPVRAAWMALGEAMSRVTSPIVFAAMYFLVVTPFGLVRRTLGRSPLARTRAAPTYWVRREPMPADEARRRLERQF